MNSISNIEIKNFKSIRHQKIEGCKRVNVFIGYPNVGKSNILEALSLASKFNNSGKPVSLKDLCRFEDLIGLFNDGDKQRTIELTIDDFVYLLFYENKSNIKYRVIYKSLYSPDSSPENISIRKINIDIGGNISESKSNKTPENVFDGNISPSPSINIKKFQFRINGKQEENNPTKLDFPFGDNLFEVLRHNSELRKNCGELFSNYNLKLYFEKDNELKIARQLDEFTIFPIPFSQVADTLQRLIFHKAAIATNQNTVLLFEEPEAHMFPPYISKFTTDIIYEDNNNQYFIATHSPFVLNELLDNVENDELGIYIVSYRKETGETFIHQMNDQDKQDAYQFGYDFFMNIDKFIPQEQHG